MNDHTITADAAEQAHPEVHDTLTLRLRNPVKVGEVEYAELKLTEPTVAQLIASSKAGTPIEQAVQLIRLNAALPMRAVEQLGQRDFEAAAAFFGRFQTQAPES